MTRRVRRGVPILPSGIGLARLLVERNARALKATWLVILSGFFEPVFYLFSIGVGVGALVGTVDDAGRQIGYAAFVAPALMATSAMNGAIYDSTMNFYYKLRHAKVFDSVLATPLGVRDVAVGELTWALLRGLVYSIAFYLVLVFAGLASSWWSLLTVPACSLIGAAFGALGLAATSFARGWSDLDYLQLVLLPLFLFSATFYPLSAYPTPARWIVQLSPLYHGVTLLRGLMAGQLAPEMLWHVAYLALLTILGLSLVTRRLAVVLYR